MEKLLIVEDSKTIRFALDELIKAGDDFEACICESYQEAALTIKNENFFAAILDLELPDAHNGEIVDLIIENNIPAIVLTATINEDLREKILSKKIVDYIVKNSIEDLNTAIFMAHNLKFFKDKKVLVVDDSLVAREQLKEMFDLLGFAVLEAVDARSAFEIISNNPDIRLITVDYEMPHMNGVQLIQKLRREKFFTTPIIFGVCGTSSGLVRAQFLKSGANDYFVKPVIKEEFNAKVANAIRLTEQYEEIIRSHKILDEYKKALDEGSIISKSDKNGNITFVNDKLCEISGYSKEELIGQNHKIFKHPQTPKSTFYEMWETILSKKTWKGIVRNLNKNGTSFYANVVIVPILDENEDVVEFIAFRNDVTQLIKSEEKLKRAFYTDSLTGLGNRHKITDELNDLKSPTLILLDIDEFKQINSFYGNEFGDKMLQVVGNKLFHFAFAHKFEAFRLEGDSFALLHKHVHKAEELIALLNSFLEQLADCEVDEVSQNISMSCGISIGYNDILHADLALSSAKTNEKNIIVFTDELKTADYYKHNIIWSKKVKDALAENRIIPFFQPIFDNKLNKISKYESLARMVEDDGSIVGPNEFLDVSKKSRTYPQITKAIIKSALNVAHVSQNKITVNLTVNDILDKERIEYIFYHIQKNSMAGKVVFELVESEGIENYEEMREFIHLVKSCQCEIAIDDFGTGYSNFEYLLKLDVDYIKIDGSLIKSLVNNHNSYSVVETMVDFAKKNNLKTVAEYVETKEIFDIVRKLDVDFSQGYFIGEPQQFMQKNLIAEVNNV